jgi:pimeloyl-ACP methyl ester carboxylesterase
MPRKASKNPADYIVPLNINGLRGRMLRLPAPGTKQAAGKEILFVYGHHSSLERWWGVMQVLNHYGTVTMPDLPGFGGMDSFYKIGKRPTVDNLADYLAAFIKLRYKNKKLVIAGMSFGFVIVTRMLQRYPELNKKVSLLVSIVGFAHRDDFRFSRPRYYTYLTFARIMKHRPQSWFFRYLALNSRVLRFAYARTPNAKHKFKLAEDSSDFDRLMEVEIGLWQENDVRTWLYTTVEFFRLDNCRVRIDLPVWHVAVKNDHYFDNSLVEQHLRIVFRDFNSTELDLKTHAPSVIADEKMAAPLFPPELRRALRRAK